MPTLIRPVSQGPVLSEEEAAAAILADMVMEYASQVESLKALVEDGTREALADVEEHLRQQMQQTKSVLNKHGISVE